MAENLLLWHQVAILTRPIRFRRVRFRRLDKLLWVLTRRLRRDCRTRLLVVRPDYVHYYNKERPHRTLRLETPRPAARSPTGAMVARPVVARPVLGGLHHAYARAA